MSYYIKNSLNDEKYELTREEFYYLINLLKEQRTLKFKNAIAEAVDALGEDSVKGVFRQTLSEIKEKESEEE